MPHVVISFTRGVVLRLVVEGKPVTVAINGSTHDMVLRLVMRVRLSQLLSTASL